jgi:methionine--tRNA ligase beta chain
MSSPGHEFSIANILKFLCYNKAMKPVISFDDFAKLDIRVGTVTDCVEKEGSDRLLRLTVDFGDEGTRNILSGIKQWYKPEDLKGKQFIFVLNLEPRKIMGEESQGMLLAADAASGKQAPLGGGKKPLPLKPKSKSVSGAPIR